MVLGLTGIGICCRRLRGMQSRVAAYLLLIIFDGVRGKVNLLVTVGEGKLYFHPEELINNCFQELPMRKVDNSTILIINDAPDALELMSLQLYRAGYQILTATNGREGYEVALRQRPDIVVSDVAMPEVSGIELCRMIRAEDRLHTIPILLISSLYKETENVVASLEAGADDYLEVPYDPLRFIAKVTRLLERRQVEGPLKFQAQLLNTVEQAVIATDLEGKISYWNRFAEKLYGWSAAEAVGVNILDLTPAQTTVEQASEIMSHLRAGRSWSGEFLVRRKDGTTFPALVTDSPIYDDEGSLVGMVGVSFDVGERKRAEESLRRANDELEKRVEQRTYELTTANASLKKEIAERTRAEQTLREEHNLLQWVIEGTTDYIFVKDLNGRYLMINSAAARFVGKPAEEILGEGDMELFPPETAQKLIEYDRQVMASGETQTLEESLLSKGILRTVSEVKSVYRSDKGKVIGLISIARDITERKRMEEALRESEERYKGLADTAFDGLVLHQDGIIKDVNRAYAEMYGYIPEELKGRNILDVTPQQLKDLVLSNITSELEKPYESLGLKKDGTFINIEVSATRCLHKGKPARLAAVRDITERKRAEEALKQSEQDYRGLFEQAHDAILVFVPEREIVLDVNERACEIYGFSRSEFIGMSLETISREVARGKAQVAETLERGDYLNFETVQYRKDGTEIFLEINASTVFYQGQRAVLSINRDITERVRAREARMQLQFRLLAAREEERRRISRELHDQMGQHLPALMLGLKALRGTGQNGPTADDRLQQLQELAERIAHDTHRLSRDLRHAALDDFGLHFVLSGYVEEWSEHCGISVDFHSTGFDEDGRLPPHFEITLYRIVQEALNNVVKHAQAEHVSLILERGREGVCIVVEDDGKGFDVEAVRNTPISERRLGLLGMQERVELVGGALEVESAPGAGTTVAARIPALMC
jgi:PAS domain S-box-containing protein